MGFRRGMDCKLYYDATPLAGEPAAGDWTEVGPVRDLTLNLETGEADVTARDNAGWRATAATLKDGSIDFEMRWDPDDDAFAAIQAAWAEGAEIALAAMDGEITESGRQGLAGNFTITNFSRGEALEEAVTVSVTAKPSSHTTWYEVA